MSKPKSQTPRDSIDDLTRILREFVIEREWEQFHTPRSLLLALVGEVGELAEQMQWASDEELLERMKTESQPLEDEVADVAIYLLRLADVLEIDLAEAIQSKIRANGSRYEAIAFRGSAEKAPHAPGEGRTGRSRGREMREE